MSAAAAPAPAKSPKKKASKPKKTSSHPTYKEMIKKAVTALKERNGSSRQAILKYILVNFKIVDEKSANVHLKMALKNGVKNGQLKQSKGSGAAGSFKLGDAAPKKAKKVKKPKAAAAKKVKKPKAAGTKKPAAKKPKAAGTKKPKAAKKSPAKKPAAKKSPAKKKAAAKKKPAAKKAAAKK